MADVTTSGNVVFSNGTVNVGVTDGLVSLPAALLDAARGWFAIYYRTGFASTDDPYAGVGLVHFRWNTTDDTQGLSMTYFPGTDVYRANRFGSGISTNVDSAPQSFASGTTKLFIARWTASTFGNAVDGGSFVDVANTFIPSPLRSTFQVGARIAANGSPVNQLASDVMWCAGGTTSFENSNSAQLWALGDIADAGGFPFAYTFFWNCDSVTYDGAPDPPAPQIGLPAVAEPYPF